MKARNKMVTLNEIKSKSYTRSGAREEGRVEEGAKADIVAGESIRLYGTRSPGSRRDPLDETYDRTFKIGDQAEYRSCNYSCYGPIVGITTKTVTIAVRQHNRDEKAKLHRLSIHEFNWRNRHFDLEKRAEGSADISQYI